MEVNSFTAPAKGMAPPRRPTPETEGRGCGSPICLDVDVGNFQHENDSTLEISRLHLKSESEKAGPPLCVWWWWWAGEGGKLGYLGTSPGYPIILLRGLEHLTSSL